MRPEVRSDRLDGILSGVKPRTFPWLPLALLVVSLLAFWVLPNAWKDQLVKVEFEGSKK